MNAKLLLQKIKELEDMVKNSNQPTITKTDKEITLQSYLDELRDSGKYSKFWAQINPQVIAEKIVLFLPNCNDTWTICAFKLATELMEKYHGCIYHELGTIRTLVIKFNHL